MVPPVPPKTGPSGLGDRRGPARSKRRLSDPFRFDRGLLAEHSPPVGGTDLRLAGADEAGRGSLAGPLVAAAVVLDYAGAPFAILRGLTDSKLLSPEVREEVYQRVLQSASHVSWVARSPATIDSIGLHRCNLSALSEALESLGGQYAFAVVDGFDLQRPDLRARAIVGADYKSAVVAAASVVAKVVRDRSDEDPRARPPGVRLRFLCHGTHRRHHPAEEPAERGEAFARRGRHPVPQRHRQTDRVARGRLPRCRPGRLRKTGGLRPPPGRGLEQTVPRGPHPDAPTYERVMEWLAETSPPRSEPASSTATSGSTTSSSTPATLSR